MRRKNNRATTGGETLVSRSVPDVCTVIFFLASFFFSHSTNYRKTETVYSLVRGNV